MDRTLQVSKRITHQPDLVRPVPAHIENASASMVCVRDLCAMSDKQGGRAHEF